MNDDIIYFGDIPVVVEFLNDDDIGSVGAYIEGQAEDAYFTQIGQTAYSVSSVVQQAVRAKLANDQLAVNQRRAIEDAQRQLGIDPTPKPVGFFTRLFTPFI